MEMPEGCSMAVLIAFIHDEKMRPSKEYKYLVDVLTERERVTTCRKNFNEAAEFAGSFFKKEQKHTREACGKQLYS